MSEKKWIGATRYILGLHTRLVDVELEGVELMARNILTCLFLRWNLSIKDRVKQYDACLPKVYRFSGFAILEVREGQRRWIILDSRPMNAAMSLWERSQIAPPKQS